MGAAGIGRWRRLATAMLTAALACACAAPALADSGTEQVALAAGGRFDLLEKMLEAQAARGALDTRDRHALCYAYSKTKRYAQLAICLDQLEATLAHASDRSTRLFALDDATPALELMRAESLIELGQYQAAAASAQRNLDWLRKDNSDDLDMVFNSMAALAMARALGGEHDAAVIATARLAAASAGDYASAKAFALARVRMALGDYDGVLAALNGDKQFVVHAFLDRLFTGGFFTGVNNWVWSELPRAFMLNKALLESGKTAEARAGFDRLLALPQVQANGEIYWMLLDERGRIADIEHDRAAALGWYRKAIDVVELQRASINTEASKIGFVGDKQALYGHAIDAALSLEQAEVAYEYMERGKSRALVDLLASHRDAPRLASHSAAGGQLLQDFEQASAAAQAQLPLDMARSDSRSASDSALRSKKQQLKASDPALASLVSVGALSLKQVREYLHGNEVLIEYYLSGKELILLAADEKRVLSFRIDAAGLDQEVRSFRLQIEQQSPAMLASSRALHAKLLGPVAALIAGRPLVIVPHGPLHYLPFGALHDGTQYLVATHQLRFLPSASVQQYLRPEGRAAIAQMLIFGNPDLGRPALDLPSAGQEAALIGQMVPDSKVLTRLAASETEFKRHAGDYRFLHLAVHGEFKGNSPLQSRLALAADGDNDGSLTVAEIYNLRLNADLVTLSACETGLSQAMNGDDMVGLIRGFQYAGSSNIIASLWSVDDQATAELMAEFYRQLQAGRSKAEALQLAQRSLWQNFPDPLFWAAFYLTGQGG